MLLLRRLVISQITVVASTAIPTMSLADPVKVSHAIKKPRRVNACAINSIPASLNHLTNPFRILPTRLKAFLIIFICSSL
jgi:hypothetical protein